MSRRFVCSIPRRSSLLGATLLCLLLPLSAAHAADDDTHAGARTGDIRIEAPVSGWRNSAIDADPQNVVQDVHYPSSDVNTRDGQSRLALIAGQVRLAPKPKPASGTKAGSQANANGAADASTNDDGPQTPPATLIVNGVAMPLKVDDTGRFSRPYAFGRGANNVEVRSADGQHRSVAQFYEANADQLPAQVRVVLSWNTDQTDLDLHVITPDGQHCFYGNRVLDNGAALDVDVTSGYGPEIFESPVAQPGRYYVYVNYYGGQGMNVTGKPAVITVATVTVISHENTVNEKKQSFIVPMRIPGDLTLVTSFVE
jgi:uncharacterized protein YfaP (DUF2135 family)